MKQELVKNKRRSRRQSTKDNTNENKIENTSLNTINNNNNNNNNSKKKKKTEFQFKVIPKPTKSPKKSVECGTQTLPSICVSFESIFISEETRRKSVCIGSISEGRLSKRDLKEVDEKRRFSVGDEGSRIVSTEISKEGLSSEVATADINKTVLAFEDNYDKNVLKTIQDLQEAYTEQKRHGKNNTDLPVRINETNTSWPLVPSCCKSRLHQ
ncbi:uncharacterized protein NDAI_0F03520 [Naumovozyma dairenensis CBS 421]|uniref:Uncharacterized protein n=1 Tax=Naumovozyma dairenensis (strain ATCC 10597 / BCRC 20456 / CBS 421 / NBRC 0211 / NRRL Y-12639) TaxID=1071378 RepID=G0WD09_NAUDC|nr:hypothetical protein NDAI_0F03520 [Naumovozyma dairenensis CBS 421]CCD25670.1 hypothetical protein NDAI_0F03520 [Naumovozyma dairenensis CBS 421]